MLGCFRDGKGKKKKGCCGEHPFTYARMKVLLSTDESVIIHTRQGWAAN